MPQWLRPAVRAATTPAAPANRPAAAGGRGIVLESLLLAAVALFFLNFNPLGAIGVGHRFSQDLVYAWFGNADWLYPRLPPETRPAPTSRPRVVVMLVDDAALALRGARWPAPLDFHAQLLSELAVLKPRAVMLDFLLLDRASRTATCTFLKSAASLREEGTATYVAVTATEELRSLDAGDCRDDKHEPIQPTQVLTPVSIRLQIDTTDFVNRRYPFEERGAADAPGTGTISAGVRMYCDTVEATAACVTRLTRDRSVDAGFELAWSPEGDPFNQRWSQARCDQLHPSRRPFCLRSRCRARRSARRWRPCLRARC